MIDTNNFDTYAQAVGYALGSIDFASNGYVYDLDEYVSIIAEGARKPERGQTTTWALPLYNLVDGKRIKVNHNCVASIHCKKNGKYKLTSHIN